MKTPHQEDPSKKTMSSIHSQMLKHRQLLNQQINKHHDNLFFYTQTLTPNYIYNLNSEDYTTLPFAYLRNLSYAELESFSQKNNGLKLLIQKLQEIRVAARILELLDIIDAGTLDEIPWDYINHIQANRTICLLLENELTEEELELSMLFGTKVLCATIATRKKLPTKKVMMKMSQTRLSIRQIIASYYPML